MDRLSGIAASVPGPLRLAERFEIVRTADGNIKFVALSESVRVEPPAQARGVFIQVMNALIDRLGSGASTSCILNSLVPDQQAIAAAIIVELRGRGVLEAAAPAPDVAPADPRWDEQRRFLANFRPTSAYITGLGPISEGATGAAPERSLRQAQVAIFGIGRLGARLVEGLSQVGVGRIIAADAGTVEATDLIDSPWTPAELGLVRAQALEGLIRRNSGETEVVVLNSPDPFHADHLPEHIDLLVLADDQFNPEHHRAINRLCMKGAVHWIGARTAGTRVEIGPFVVPGETPCYRCLELRRLANVAGYSELLDNLVHLAAGGRGVGRLNVTLGYEFLIVEIIKILTGFSRPTTLGALFTFDLLSFEARRHPVLKLPRCPDCGAGARSRPAMSLWNQDAFVFDR